jgi:hypothetical protein
MTMTIARPALAAAVEPAARRALVVRQAKPVAEPVVRVAAQA